jgi:hypothetical protein
MLVLVSKEMVVVEEMVASVEMGAKEEAVALVDLGAMVDQPGMGEVEDQVDHQEGMAVEVGVGSTSIAEVGVTWPIWC